MLVMDVGHDVLLQPTYYRLYGIQAPEIRPLKTRAAGTAARDYLRQLIDNHGLPNMGSNEPWLGNGVWLVAKTLKSQRRRDYRPRALRGKFGRFLVELLGMDSAGNLVNLNDKMLRSGHAVPYPA